MCVMISINPPYTKYIEMGFKPIEFRNKPIKAVIPGTTIYIYETKNKGGCGRVILKAKVGMIVDFKNTNPRDVSVLKERHNIAVNRVNAPKPFEVYLTMIGYSRKCRFGIILEDVESIDMELNDFICNGKVIVRPPQNMCSCELIPNIK